MPLFMFLAYGFVCVWIYHICPRRFRWVILLVASYGFYASRSLSGLPFLLLTTCTTWLGALVIARIASATEATLQSSSDLMREGKKRIRALGKRRQRTVLIAVLALNFTILAVLKYTDDVRGLFGASPLGLLLPLGISFYTFQSMGYLIDVYNGKVYPERNPFKFALFVSFFPQLLQGPIARYDQLAAQLVEPHDIDADGLQRGFLLILWGLLKKLVIADRLLPLVDEVFSAQAGVYGGAINVLAVLCYAVQQYCDFSGGIDLVTGLAEQFGIRLAQNFRRPYFATSLGDFWRRWHISLGSWMRDYVFYPFALTKPMNRLSKVVKARLGTEVARVLPAMLGNLLVFLLVGLWHGATSNMLIWGHYNGCILALSALLEPLYKRFSRRLPNLTSSKGFHVFRVLRTFLIVNIGWFFDRCAHASDALRMMGSVFTDFRAGQLGGTLFTLGLSPADFGVICIAVMLLFTISFAQEQGVSVREWIVTRRLPVRWLILAIGILAVLILGVWGPSFDEAAFIYEQF